jgi:hypothetical protein
MSHSNRAGGCLLIQLNDLYYYKELNMRHKKLLPNASSLHHCTHSCPRALATEKEDPFPFPFLALSLGSLFFFFFSSFAGNLNSHIPCFSHHHVASAEVAEIPDSSDGRVKVYDACTSFRNKRRLYDARFIVQQLG